MPIQDDPLTRRVIGCFLTAYNELGSGLPEGVYAAALEILLRDAGIAASREHLAEVFFRDHKVGHFRLDFLIEEYLALELKAGHVLPPGSRAQLVTYLRASRKSLGLLLFAGPSPEIERVRL